ncbi:hypothetical protein JCM5350_007075 [Sporobolomyces pararoseus]
MSFSSLPEELVDLVALKVRDSGSPSDLARLCLVSRQTLPSARRALYEEPSRFERQSRESAFPRAKQLLTSLQANHGQLGRLVRSTLYLYLAIMLWGSTKNNVEMEEEKGLSAKTIQAWYLDVLRACPNLRTVDIFCWSDRVLELSLQAISASIPTIQQIKFRNGELSNGAGEHIQLSTANSLFRLYLTRPLVNIDLSLYSRTEASSAPNFGLPIETKGLSLHLLPSLVDEIFKYFPSPLSPTPLRKITLSLPLPATSTAILPLASISDNFGKSLEEFVVAFYGLWPSTRVDSYGHRHRGPPLAPIGFRNFTRLETLKLLGFRGPSEEFLETLVEHAPLLHRISLSRSVWVSLSHPTSIVPEEVFPEHKIVESVSKFIHLRFIHLGILPTNSHGRYAWIVDEMGKLGVSVEFEICS